MGGWGYERVGEESRGGGVKGVGMGGVEGGWVVGSRGGGVKD